MSRLTHCLLCGVGLFLVLFSHPLLAADNKSPEASLERGAEVFVERCVLCHGNDGMGEGVLPLNISTYPDTNLAVPRFAKTLQEVRDAVFWGGYKSDMSELSPPWGNELTCAQLESVSLFVQTLREETPKALALLEDAEAAHRAVKVNGALVYQNRCALCHGAQGDGTGKMARVITSPPPFDLTKSIMPQAYLEMIINQGGAELGRSGQMPPWSETLSKEEVAAVIDYIVTLREPVIAQQ